MKRVIVILTMAFSLMSFHTAFAAKTNFAASSKSKASQLESPRDAPLLGEKLTFDVFWMGVPVGIGTLEVKEKLSVGGREVYHVVAIAKTNDFLSKLYPVEDEAHSFIDAKEFYSLEFHKTLREGRYRADEKVVYDYARNKSVHESLLNGSRNEYEILGPTHDFLSAFFWFRLQPVIVGKSLKTHLHNKGKNYDLELQTLRQERKELRGGEVMETIVVEPKTRLRDILYQRGRAWVYFSMDAQRTPVWITIHTPFGPVVGVLRRGD